MRAALSLPALFLFPWVPVGQVMAAAPAPQRAAAPSLLPVSRPIALPCGIADPAGRTGFFANPTGGIDAVNLKTGELVWETTEAQVPLVVAGTRLLAQAGVHRNRLRIFVFDLTQAGHCLLESDPVVLPDWVVTAPAPGRSFGARWRLDANELVLAWEATAWYSGSARPGAREEAAARKHAAGAARIDLDTGRVELGPAETSTAEPPLDLFPELEKRAVRWQGVVAGRRSAVVLEEAGAQQALMLRSWDTGGKEQEPRELLRGRRLLVQPTLDGHFLCLRDGGSAPDEKNLGQDKVPQFWTLVSLDLGAPVGRLPYEPGTQAVAVFGTRAVYSVSGPIRSRPDRPVVQPRTVKAYDLQSEKPLWHRAVAGKLLAPPVR